MHLPSGPSPVNSLAHSNSTLNPFSHTPCASLFLMMSEDSLAALITAAAHAAFLNKPRQLASTLQKLSRLPFDTSELLLVNGQTVCFHVLVIMARDFNIVIFRNGPCAINTKKTKYPALSKSM